MRGRRRSPPHDERPAQRVAIRRWRTVLVDPEPPDRRSKSRNAATRNRVCRTSRSAPRSRSRARLERPEGEPLERIDVLLVPAQRVVETQHLRYKAGPQPERRLVSCFARDPARRPEQHLALGISEHRPIERQTPAEMLNQLVGCNQVREGGRSRTVRASACRCCESIARQPLAWGGAQGGQRPRMAVRRWQASPRPRERREGGPREPGGSRVGSRSSIAGLGPVHLPHRARPVIAGVEARARDGFPPAHVRGASATRLPPTTPATLSGGRPRRSRDTGFP